MDEGGVFDEFGMTVDSIERYKMLVLKKSGSHLTFKWGRFKNLKVNTFIRINNIDSDYIITLK